jgi:hypothetical protein
MDPSFKGNFSKGCKIGRPEKIYLLKLKLEDSSYSIMKSLALKDSYTCLKTGDKFLRDQPDESKVLRFNINESAFHFL